MAALAVTVTRARKPLESDVPLAQGPELCLLLASEEPWEQMTPPAGGEWATGPICRRGDEVVTAPSLHGSDSSQPGPGSLCLEKIGQKERAWSRASKNSRIFPAKISMRYPGRPQERGSMQFVSTKSKCAGDRSFSY